MFFVVIYLPFMNFLSLLYIGAVHAVALGRVKERYMNVVTERLVC